MAQLAKATMAILCLSTSVHADGALSLPDPAAFDGASYFCSADDPNLQTYQDVLGLISFMSAVRHAEKVLDVSNCPSNRMQVMTMITGMEDKAAASAAMTGYLFAWVSRSRDQQGFEVRYANDAELLVHAALLCDGLLQDRMTCMNATFATLPTEFFADSPVFCDLVPKGSQMPEAFGKAPDPAIRQELPGLCTVLKASHAQALTAEDWWADLQTNLFPVPASLAVE